MPVILWVEVEECPLRGRAASAGPPHPPPHRGAGQGGGQCGREEVAGPGWGQVLGSLQVPRPRGPGRAGSMARAPRNHYCVPPGEATWERRRPPHSPRAHGHPASFADVGSDVATVYVSSQCACAGAGRGLQRGGDSWRGGWGASRPPRQRGAAPGGEPGTRALGRPLEVPGGEATGGGTGGRTRLLRSPRAPLGPSGRLHAGTGPPRRQLLSDEEARRAASGLAWRGSPRVAPSAPRRSPAKLTRVSFSN